MHFLFKFKVDDLCECKEWVAFERFNFNSVLKLNWENWISEGDDGIGMLLKSRSDVFLYDASVCETWNVTRTMDSIAVRLDGHRTEIGANSGFRRRSAKDETYVTEIECDRDRGGGGLRWLVSGCSYVTIRRLVRFGLIRPTWKSNVDRISVWVVVVCLETITIFVPKLKREREREHERRLGRNGWPATWYLSIDDIGWRQPSWTSFKRQKQRAKS
jgi:hypothetical protein